MWSLLILAVLLLAFPAFRVYCAIAAAVFIVILILRRVAARRRPAPAETAAPQPQETPAPAPAPADPKPAPVAEPAPAVDARTIYSELYSAPQSMNGRELAYSYPDVGFFVPDDLSANAKAVPPREELFLSPEPANEYDPDAVAVYRDGRKIGYLYKGKLRDMWRNYADRPDRMCRAVSQPWLAGKPLLGLFFYKAPAPWTPGPDAREFKLTRSRSAAAQDALSLCSVGDEVEIDSDMGDDYEYTYYALSVGDRIGAFPASARQYIEDHDVVIAHISEIEEDDAGKYVVYVTLEPADE